MELVYNNTFSYLKHCFPKIVHKNIKTKNVKFS